MSIGSETVTAAQPQSDIVGEVPAWDDATPSHPLLVVSYPKIAAGDQSEIDKLYKASTQLGFFYLEGHGLNPEPILRVAQDTFHQPLSEKEPFKRGTQDAPFGYRMPNAHGVEFICVAADDAKRPAERTYRSYPSETEKGLASGVYKTYVEAADQVAKTLLAVLNDKLGLPKDTLLKLHEGKGVAESRTIRKPAEDDVPIVADENPTGAHTDFGTLTLLDNNGIGGLQVLVPGSKTAADWQYVKPLPGKLVCNIADLLNIFSGGLLKSNMHRVISPPGKQKTIPRWSQVYFLRPSCDVQLRPLSDQSPIIAEAAKTFAVDIPENATAYSWLWGRVIDRKQGTEHSKVQ